jgi:hypothetical protein
MYNINEKGSFAATSILAATALENNTHIWKVALLTATELYLFQGFPLEY